MQLPDSLTQSGYSNCFLNQTGFTNVPESRLTPITLDQFLKQIGVVGSGGQAKVIIQAGEVMLNGVVETRRGKKLAAGDVVTLGNEQFRVPAN